MTRKFHTAVARSVAAAMLLAGLLAGGQAAAKNDKHEDGPGKHGAGHSEKHADKENRHEDGKHKPGKARHGNGPKPQAVPVGGYFQEGQRVQARAYFDDQYRHGRCPPGLAKKNNGCMPPGQAKKWQTGQPLPRNVVYYAVPQPMVTKLGPPPAGHKYVRVASDILLVTVGTMMVVDGISGLMN